MELTCLLAYLNVFRDPFLLMILLAAGHLTIQITLHDQPIQDSPVSVQVGAKQTHYVRQVAEPTPVCLSCLEALTIRLLRVVPLQV